MTGDAHAQNGTTTPGRRTSDVTTTRREPLSVPVAGSQAPDRDGPNGSR